MVLGWYLIGTRLVLSVGTRLCSRGFLSKGFLFWSKDFCFGRRISVLSKDVTITRRLGPSALYFFCLTINASFCVVEGCLFRQRMYVLSKDLCSVEGCMFCERSYVLLNNFCLSKDFCELDGFL